jgi:hypothetical protein
MKEKYIPGQGCLCHAHSEAECGCDVDWTPREVYELRATISDMEIRHSATMLHTQSIVNEANELREQRDRLAEALEMVRDADEDCHKDGLTTIPKAARHRIDMALAAVKGGPQ